MQLKALIQKINTDYKKATKQTEMASLFRLKQDFGLSINRLRELHEKKPKSMKVLLNFCIFSCLYALKKQNQRPKTQRRHKPYSKELRKRMLIEAKYFELRVI